MSVNYRYHSCRCYYVSEPASPRPEEGTTPFTHDGPKLKVMPPSSPSSRLQAWPLAVPPLGPPRPPECSLPCKSFLAVTYLWGVAFHVVWLPKPRVQYVMGGACTAVIPVIENRALETVCEQVNPAGKAQRGSRGPGKPQAVLSTVDLLTGQWTYRIPWHGIRGPRHLVESSFLASSLATPSHNHIPWSPAARSGLLALPPTCSAPSLR